MKPAIIAIIAIAMLQALALWLNVDGSSLYVSLIALSGLGGYALKEKPPIK